MPRRVYALALSLAIAVVGCDGGAANDRRLTIALVAGNLSDPYWQAFQCGAARRANELDVKLTSYVSSSSSAQEIATNFNAAALAKPDAITYSPFQAGQFSIQVRSLMRRGIPVVTSQPLDPDTGYVTVRSTNDGGPYADFAASLVGSSGTVVAMGGIAGSEPLRQRVEPLLSAISKARPGVEILPTQYTSFDVNKTAQIASSLMLAHPDLKLIVASTGPEGQGVAAAVAQANKAGKVQIMAFDAVPSEVRALKDGVIQGLIAQSPQQIGAQQITEAVRYLHVNRGGGPVSPIEEKTLPLKLITADNVDDPQVRSWMYEPTCGS